MSTRNLTIRLEKFTILYYLIKNLESNQPKDNQHKYSKRVDHSYEF